MPTKTKNLESKADFLKQNIDRLLQVNQQLDLRLYPTLGIPILTFLFSLYNILNNSQKGVIGFIVIACGSLISIMLVSFSFKQFSPKSGYGYILLNGLLSRSEEKIKDALSDLLCDSQKLIEFYTWQTITLLKASEAKRKFQEAALHVLIMSFLIGVILIIAAP